MKVLWGFEPMACGKASVKGMSKLIHNLVPAKSDIEIGYVVTENESFFYTAPDRSMKDRSSSLPKELILDEMKKAGIAIPADYIFVAHHPTPSITTSVKRFLDLATERNAELIALFTHNKRGIERLVSGSFAETTIHHSHVDLLLAGPSTKYPSKVKSILYCSDFSAQSKKDLQKVIALCQKTGSKLTVFHAAEVIYKWSLDEKNPQILDYRRATDKMAQWIEDTCQKARIPFTLSLRSEFTPVSEMVSKAAKKARANLIVVSAKKGPLASLMGGSVTRQILRNGTYPVLILKN